MKSTGKVVVLTILTVLIFVFFAYRSYLKRNPYYRNVEEQKDVVDMIEEVMVSGPLSEVSRYKGNRLKNGTSPFDELYGKGIYSDTKNSLLVVNQGSSDLVIFLVLDGSDKIIRNEYINAHSSFDMTQIPNSTCYIKYYYGHDWNPTRKTREIITGGFESDEQYVVSDNPNDILSFDKKIQGDYFYYSSYELTLETTKVEGSTMSQENVNASDFFLEK